MQNIFKKLFAVVTCFSMAALSLLWMNLHIFLPAAAKKFPRPEASSRTDIRGEIHVHSLRSHDSRGSLEEIARAADASGIRWIILTDHRRTSDDDRKEAPRMLYGVLFFFGTETSDGASLLTAPGAHGDQLLACGHIEHLDASTTCAHIDALELVNLHANAIEKKQRIYFNLLFAPGRFYETLGFVPSSNFKIWHRLAAERGKIISVVAGPDAHANQKVLGTTIDTYDIMFRLISTHILLEKNEELSEETLFRAVRDGKTYIAFDYLGDTTGFSFYKEENHGRLVAKMPTIAGNVEIRFFRENQMVSVNTNALEGSIEKPDPGLWRVEVYRNGKPWIISSMIPVR